MRHLLACGKARLRVFKPVLSCLERWGGESGNSRDKTDETSCLLLGRNRPACVSRGQTIPKACAALALAHAGAVSLPLARVLSLAPSFSLSVSLFLSVSLCLSQSRMCVDVSNKKCAIQSRAHELGITQRDWPTMMDSAVMSALTSRMSSIDEPNLCFGP